MSASTAGSTTARAARQDCAALGLSAEHRQRGAVAGRALEREHHCRAAPKPERAYRQYDRGGALRLACDVCRLALEGRHWTIITEPRVGDNSLAIDDEGWLVGTLISAAERTNPNSDDAMEQAVAALDYSDAQQSADRCVSDSDGRRRCG